MVFAKSNRKIMVIRSCHDCVAQAWELQIKLRSQVHPSQAGGIRVKLVTPDRCGFIHSK